MPINNRDDALELLGQIIDMFDDFLESKGVDLHNPDREGDDCAAVFYSDDYEHVRGELISMLEGWGIVERGLVD